MTTLNFLLVFLGGGLGSMLRYGISILFSKSNQTFPWATLISNLLATALLAMLYLWLRNNTKPEWLLPLLGIGFCGGFSTFSTFSAENAILFQQQQYAFLALNIVVSLALGLGVFIWTLKS